MLPMPDLPDNRIRIQGPRIDFVNDVGLTGQDHDDYPAAGAQARFDLMRSYLIGLLSCQSSYYEPTQYRNGTLWFDLSVAQLKINVDNEWVNISNVIGLTADLTLAEWYTAISDIVASFQADITFSGSCDTDNVAQIPIPESLRSLITNNTRCFLYKNGMLIDPRKCTFIGTPSSSIRLSGVTIDDGDEYTVILKVIPTTSFYSPNVNIP